VNGLTIFTFPFFSQPVWYHIIFFTHWCYDCRLLRDVNKCWL